MGAGTGTGTGQPFPAEGAQRLGRRAGPGDPTKGQGGNGRGARGVRDGLGSPRATKETRSLALAA